jgi:hypothetical protein
MDIYGLSVCTFQIFIKAMETMSDLFEELEEDEEMVTPAQIGLMLVDWTDPSKTVYAKFGTASRSIMLIKLALGERKRMCPTSRCT